jgi:anti-sigma factor RsiW
MKFSAIGHLSAEEFVDLVDGKLSASRLAHVPSCSACQGRLADLRRLAEVVRADSAPEPSPLFWERFSARVSDAIRSEPAPSPRWMSGFWVRRLLPFAATGVIVVGLVAGLLPTGSGHRPASGGAKSASHGAAGVPDVVAQQPVAADEDAPWGLVAELTGSVDSSQVENTSLDPEPGSADEASLQLSGLERQELVRLLRAELRQSPGLVPEP